MEVKIPCPCDESPHEQDTVTLRDVMDSHRALVITKSVGFIETTDPRIRPAEVLATMSELYVLLGVESWTLRSGNKAMPLTDETIRRRILDNAEVSLTVIEAADSLYNKAILLPLMKRALRSSQRSPTDEPTSPRPRGEQPRRPKPSKRSSISTIPTAGIETTSSRLDGASSSSQNSESAA